MTTREKLDRLVDQPPTRLLCGGENYLAATYGE